MWNSYLRLGVDWSIRLFDVFEIPISAYKLDSFGWEASAP